MNSTEVKFPADLDLTTQTLVKIFAEALAEKLFKAQEKYGHSNGWSIPGWEEECRQHLNEHIAKGDPLDVAAYCAFMWHHGWSASPTEEPKA